MSYYCHSTPGRLRIKTPVIKRNPVEIEKVRRLLQPLPEVGAFDINALTGSITINYTDSATDPESILNILRENGYFKVSPIKEEERPIETRGVEGRHYGGEGDRRGFHRKSLRGVDVLASCVPCLMPMRALAPPV